MAKKSMDEVKQLIDLGKEKGFLTYEEVNDLLPPDIVSSDQIDDVMSMFGDMDIEIVDSAQKVKIPKIKMDLEEEEEHEGEQEEVEFEPGTLGRTSDPVRMYLREMGSVSLLTREGEVEIAKRIEVGERDVASVILNTPITVKEVISLGRAAAEVPDRRHRDQQGRRGRGAGRGRGRPPGDEGARHHRRDQDYDSAWKRSMRHWRPARFLKAQGARRAAGADRY